MLIAIAVFCTLGEAVFTALEVAMGAVSRARLRALVEAERLQRAIGATSPVTATASVISSGSAPAFPAGDTPAAGIVPTPEATAHAANPQAANPAAQSGGARMAQRAEQVLQLLEQRERLTLMFILVTALLMWATASLLMWEARAAQWPLWALPLALAGVLFVAEVLPLLLAARDPEGVALRGVGLATTSMTVLWPLLMVLGRSGYAIARLLGAGPEVTTRITEGELRTALAAAGEEGVIEHDERAMLEGAMDFREKLVSEVMTPRIDIVGVPATATLKDALNIAVREAHSRLPVYDGTLGKIVGVLSTKDLIPHLRNAHQPGAPSAELPSADGQPVAGPFARDVARMPFFVPENKRIAPTLEQLRHQRSLMAIVVDANGGTAGVVTLEDLLEEIVGEIQDEYDDEEPRLRVVEGDRETANEGHEAEPSGLGPHGSGAAHIVLCDGDVTVREFGRFWRSRFAETVQLHGSNGADADASLSLATLSLQLFDSVPQPGDRIRAGTVAWSAAIVHGGKDVGTAVTDGTANGSKADESATHGDRTGDGTRIGTVVSGSTVDSRSPHDIELEIVAMDGPRIEQVKLEKVEP